MSMLQEIFAHPIAHRGLHDKSRELIENTPSAVSAAIEQGFGVEVDLQETADGQALVHHDYVLDRLVDGTGQVNRWTASELTGLAMKQGGDKLWMLQDLLDLTAGRAPLVIEIKSRRARDAQADFVRGILDTLVQYKGPVCIKSFDPDMLSVARAHRPEILRGIVSFGFHDEYAKTNYTRMDRFILRNLLHTPRTAPHFISYGIQDLPAFGPSIMKKLKGTPIMSWTVRTQQDRERAALFADQIVFEGFVPPAG
ncbi:glycerophosphodiester phosphodiesterase [Roseibium sp. CAU 1637]|uniref:Glycerophosphodiester phosphodiesterase n=1 Tax=Roseibium limicola TaxID=2816037 RepID=A0A939EPJ0_9HYPH|nr:glycerophosphodiester phosphodiesterase family protein [Roseibium limicola]MBO0344749.1 glycerophosphodiester phosphodiesterase [Roseibium limicola]